MNTAVTLVALLLGMLGLFAWGARALRRRSGPVDAAARPPPATPSVQQRHRPPHGRAPSGAPSRVPMQEPPVDEQLLCLRCGGVLSEGCMVLHEGGIVVSCPHCGDRYPLEEGA